MAYSLESISRGVQHRAPRIVCLGGAKVGKSTFAAGANNPIFLPVKGEEGIDALDVARFPAAESFDDVIGMLGVLYNEQHDHQTVVIDSTSALEPLLWQNVCRANNVDGIEKVGGGYGKGYTEALDRWRLMTDWLDALRAQKNMASILIGHVKVKTFNDPTVDAYDTYTFDINDKASAMLYRWADCILFANTKAAVTKEDQGFNKTKARAIDTAAGQRFLYTQKRPAHPGGGRGAYGQIPYELPLEWQAFINAVAVAAQTQTETQIEKQPVAVAS